MRPFCLALILVLAAAVRADLPTASNFDDAYTASLSITTPPSDNPSITATTPPSTPTAPVPSPPKTTRKKTSTCPKGFRLVWNDEFTTVASLKKWKYQVGDGSAYGIPGWGNKELEVYTNSTDNANVALGKLVITARTTTGAQAKRWCGSGSGAGASPCYTSARLRTWGKFSISPSFKKGNQIIRIAARLRFPAGAQGLWPAFWLLPEASPANCSGCGKYGPWSSSGAITVVQSWNAMSNATGGIAFGGPAPNVTAFSNYASSLTTPDTFHEYVFEWSRKAMRWTIDGVVVHSAKSARNGTVPNGWYTTGTPGYATPGPDSPFDQNFYLLLNMAVGGEGVGATPQEVKATLAKPKSFQVDYVRVCRR